MPPLSAVGIAGLQAGEDVKVHSFQFLAITPKEARMAHAA